MKFGIQNHPTPRTHLLFGIAMCCALVASGGSAAAGLPPTASGTVLAAAAATSPSQIDQVINDMSLPSEALVIDPRFSWQYNPQVTMPAPRGDAIPSWWGGNRPTWTNAELSWFTAFEAQGNTSKNTRLQIKDLRFYVLSEATRQWSLIDATEAPETTLWSYPFDYVSGMSGANVRTESSGGVSMKPKYPNFHHGWGHAKAINAADVRAVFATVDFRLTLDNPNGVDDRASAKFVVDSGADYYPDMSLKWSLGYAPGVGNGRMMLATSNWRSATLLVPNKNYGSTMAEMRSNPPPLSSSGPSTPTPVPTPTPTPAPAPTPTPTPTTPPVPLGQPFIAVTKNSSQCIDVSGAAMTDGAAIIQWGCSAGADNQQWILVAHPNAAYSLVSKSSGKCLDVTSFSTADGAPIQQYSCTAGPNQLFTVTTESDGYHRLVAKHSNKCLGIAAASATAGAKLEQSACVAGANHQRWLLK